MKIDLSSPDLWKRPLLLMILLSLCWFWYSGMMLHHVWDSPFLYKGADPAYWLLGASGIFKLLLLNGSTALVFSILLLLSFILALVFQDNRKFTILAGVLLLLYQIVFNAKIGYHTHHLFGFQIVLLPYYFSKERYAQSFGLARILAILVYLSAGAFKLKGMGWMHMDSFANTLQNQHAAYFYFNSDTIRSEVAFYLIGHPSLAYSVFLSAMCLQLFFVIGLFTRRFDSWLAVFLIGFHTMDWILMNLGVFMGMTLLVSVFLVKAEVNHKNAHNAMEDSPDAGNSALP